MVGMWMGLDVWAEAAATGEAVVGLVDVGEPVGRQPIEPGLPSNI